MTSVGENGKISINNERVDFPVRQTTEDYNFGRKFKNWANNLTTGDKWLIASLIAAIVMSIFIILAVKHQDDYEYNPIKQKQVHTELYGGLAAGAGAFSFISGTFFIIGCDNKISESSKKHASNE